MVYHADIDKVKRFGRKKEVEIPAWLFFARKMDSVGLVPDKTVRERLQAEMLL